MASREVCRALADNACFQQLCSALCWRCLDRACGALALVAAASFVERRFGLPRQPVLARSHCPAKRLTRAIMETSGSSQLLTILDKSVDSPIFNDFHMSAAFTKFARFKDSSQQFSPDLRSHIWQRLAARLPKLIKQNSLPPRGAVVLQTCCGRGQSFTKIAVSILQRPCLHLCSTY